MSAARDYAADNQVVRDYPFLSQLVRGRIDMNSFLKQTMLVFAVLAALAGEAVYSGPPRNPLIRVVTVSQDGLQAEPGKAMLNATLARLDRTAAFKPDVACLPESFTRGAAEAVPGPTTDRLGAWAKQHSCYVICPMKVCAGQREFNSAVLIDRAGHVVGRYDKIRPTEGELSKGICPGSADPPVFETDFGTIGIQICFDVNWRGQWRRLKQQGAKIIFFPSAFPAARQARRWPG